MQVIQDGLIFGGVILVVLLLSMLIVLKPRGIIAWYKGEDSKGALASAALGIAVVFVGGCLISLLTGQAKAQSVLDNRYGHFLNHAYTWAGIDQTRNVSPQCVPGSTADRVTSNMGFGLNLYQSPSRRVDVDLTWTHHSCVFGSDRNSYDGLGLKVVWRPWVRSAAY